MIKADKNHMSGDYPMGEIQFIENSDLIRVNFLFLDK